MSAMNSSADRAEEQAGDDVGDRHQPGDVEGPGSGRPRSRATDGAGLLVERPGDVAAVERVDRQQVEQEEHQVHAGEQLEERADLLAGGDLGRARRSRRDPADADDPDRPLRVPFLAEERGPEQRGIFSGIS